MMISTNFPISYCEIDDGFMDAWTYDPLQVNSTDAIFKITICHWSPLLKFKDGDDWREKWEEKVKSPKGSPQTLSGHLFLKNHKLKTVKQQKGKKSKGTS